MYLSGMLKTRLKAGKGTGQNMDTDTTLRVLSGGRKQMGEGGSSKGQLFQADRGWGLCVKGDTGNETL